jgi:hypothetical protein
VRPTAKSISLSTNASMRAGVSSGGPAACVSAAMSLARMALEEVATGMEPRVPQNLTRIGASARLERGQAGRRGFDERVGAPRAGS